MKIHHRTAQLAEALDSGRRTFTRGCGAFAAALLLEAARIPRAHAASRRDLAPAAQLNAFLEEFAATGAGKASLDLSAGAFRRKLETTSAKLRRLRAIDRNALKGDDLLNYRFAESLLVGQVLEQERMLWSMDPRVYLPFSELSQLMENPDATEADSATALRFLEALPGQLADGQQISRSMSRAFANSRSLWRMARAVCAGRPDVRSQAPRSEVRASLRPAHVPWVRSMNFGPFAGSAAAHAQRQLCDGQNRLRPHVEGAIPPRSRCRFPIRLRTRAIRSNGARTRTGRGAHRPRPKHGKSSQPKSRTWVRSPAA